MKRIDLIKELEGLGGDLVRHGGKHDWYRQPANGVSQAVPRHREIKERLARSPQNHSAVDAFGRNNRSLE